MDPASEPYPGLGLRFWRARPASRTHTCMDSQRLPLEFGNIPLGSLYEERLVEDLLLLVDVVAACRDGDDARLAELGVGTVRPSSVAT